MSVFANMTQWILLIMFILHITMFRAVVEGALPAPRDICALDTYGEYFLIEKSSALYTDFIPLSLKWYSPSPGDPHLEGNQFIFGPNCEKIAS
jgi:hypothetical protein